MVTRKPPKVAHFDDTIVPGGAEVILIEICKRISQYGFEPEVLHFGNPWLKGKCEELGISCAEVPGYKHYRSIKTLPLFSMKFARFLKNRGVNVLHSHLLGPITAGSMAARLSGIKHVGTLHDSYIVEERPLRYKLLQMASLFGTKLVTVSESMKNYYESLQRFYKIKFQTIYNGVDTDKFSLASNANLRKELKLDVDDIILINVARLATIKRHDVLIKALKLIKTSRPFKLLIIGDGPCNKDINELVIKLGLVDKVGLLGFRDDIPDLLLMSDCFVLSSDSEGLSCSIEEAMAAGLPAVVTDAGGNRELIKNGISGYLVPRNNPGLLAEGLEKLITNKDLRMKLGNQACNEVNQRLTIEGTVHKYANIYRSLLS